MNTAPIAISSESLDSAADCLAQSYECPSDRVEKYKLLIRALLYALQARRRLNMWTYGTASSPYNVPTLEQKLRIRYIAVIDGKPELTDFSLNDLSKVQYWLDNGSGGFSPEELFNRGWHFDIVERFIKQRIVMDRLHVLHANRLS